MATYDQVSDAQLLALRAELYTGQLNEMLMQWLRFEGAVGNDLMRLWHTFFNLKVLPAGQHNERIKAWYAQEGFSRSSLSDAALAYWKNRATPPPPP